MSHGSRSCSPRRRLAALVAPWALGAALLATAPAALAVDPADWSREDIHRFDFDIELRTLKLLRQHLEPHAFAREIGLEPPVFPPALAPPQVAEILRVELERTVEDAFPKSRLTEIVREAEQKFRMYKWGDEIELRMRLRRSEFSVVTRRYYERKQDKLRLGDAWVSLSDLHPDELPHFDLVAHEDAVRRHIRRETIKLEEARKEFLAKQEPLISAKIWRDYGYVQLASTGEWVPREKYFEDKYQQRWQELYNQIRQEVAAGIYTEAGLIFNAAANEWAPPAGTTAAAVKPVAAPRESVLERAKRLIQEARKRQPPPEIVPETGTATPTPATGTKPPPKPATGGGLFED